ncbi:hypothetical protein OsI_14955 [Oryza sativa Indica Group]|uniref:Uncharacterized protein n=1 Tax=Oryza sativa subsp. indica TaxID=39946 RepID=A2XQN9_ORYSI|nr:hypothetical protein OsI_14955 [Oryza sativa Indica Group]
MASPDPSSTVVEVLHGMTIPIELSNHKTGLTNSSRRQSLTRRPRPSCPSRGRFLAAPATNAASSPPLFGITSSLAQAIDRRRLVASSALCHHPRRVGTARACGIGGDRTAGEEEEGRALLHPTRRRRTLMSPGEQPQHILELEKLLEEQDKYVAVLTQVTETQPELNLSPEY